MQAPLDNAAAVKTKADLIKANDKLESEAGLQITLTGPTKA
jgi:hypothetical protein